mmetsp:Transcript_170/g.416  ORF Transcript_170/g.416 Transcript_170/m.416 type:complete len:102 (+) Transcript_170:111-416(+)
MRGGLNRGWRSLLLRCCVDCNRGLKCRTRTAVTMRNTPTMTSWRGFHFDAYLENHSGYDDESPLLKLRCIVYGDAYSPYCWMISGSNVLTTSERGEGPVNC